MAKQTQTEILNEVLVELQEIKRGLPNGQIALMQKSLEDLEEGQKLDALSKRTITGHDAIQHTGVGNYVLTYSMAGCNTTINVVVNNGPVTGPIQHY